MLKQETLDCNILAGLIGVWSLFTHSMWLATYLLYLIVSSVLATVAFLSSVLATVAFLSSVVATVAFLESVTSAVNILG